MPLNDAVKPIQYLRTRQTAGFLGYYPFITSTPWCYGKIQNQYLWTREVAGFLGYYPDITRTPWWCGKTQSVFTSPRGGGFSMLLPFYNPLPLDAAIKPSQYLRTREVAGFLCYYPDITRTPWWCGKTQSIMTYPIGGEFSSYYPDITRTRWWCSKTQSILTYPRGGGFSRLLHWYTSDDAVKPSQYLRHREVEGFLGYYTDITRTPWWCGETQFGVVVVAECIDHLLIVVYK